MQGVVYLHTRTPPIVHGDIKPANILIDGSGTPKLCDFGLSKIFHEDSDASTGLTTTTAYTGTSRYLAIELVDPNEVVTPTLKTDIWALGCVGLKFIFSEEPYQNRVNSVQIFEDIRKGIPPTKFSNDMATNYQDSAKMLGDCWARIPSECPDAIKLTEKFLKYFPTCASEASVSGTHSTTVPQNVAEIPSETSREEKFAASGDLTRSLSIPIDLKDFTFNDKGSPSSRRKVFIGDDSGYWPFRPSMAAPLLSRAYPWNGFARDDARQVQGLTLSLPGFVLNPALEMDGSTKKTCKHCGLPGRYGDNARVESGGRSPYDSNTLCEQCHKKIKQYIEKWTIQDARAGLVKIPRIYLPRLPTWSTWPSTPSDQQSNALNDSDVPERRPRFPQPKHDPVPWKISLSYRELFRRRFQQPAKLGAEDAEDAGPQHTWQWRDMFWIGNYKVGKSSWYSGKDAAKEHAARRPIK